MVRGARGTDYSAFTDTITLNTPLDLSHFAAPLLTYWTRYKLSSYDAIRVQVSVDGGGTWTTIQAITNLTNNTDWMRQRVDLSPYIGQSVHLRFAFKAWACSSGCTANTVWWIDDVTIAEQPAPMFSNDLELGVTDWTLGDRWTRTDAQSHSGNWSARHARGTDYTAYTSILSLKVPLTAAARAMPVLSFWTRYRLSDFESVQVQVKPAGGSWTTLWNRADAIDLDWIPWQLDLSAYAGQSLDLRFRFHGNACDPNTQTCMSNPTWWIDDGYVAELSAPSGDLPFVDDFETSQANWTMTTAWSTVVDVEVPSGLTNTYLSGTVRTVTYQDPENLRLTEPLDLSGIRQPTLRFETRYAFLGYPAYGAVQVSAVGDDDWETLEEIENATIPSWESHDLDLSAYAGQSIYVRFRLYSTVPVYYPDIWYIDDVVIQETAP